MRTDIGDHGGLKRGGAAFFCAASNSRFLVLASSMLRIWPAIAWKRLNCARPSAHGFAMLGTIGFEGRFDYAATGSTSTAFSTFINTRGLMRI